ncbi:MAG: hypothetical protein Q7U78_10595 [Gallionella sp.]|nr:hypothetical protein [Gallionella sp.]
MNLNNNAFEIANVMIVILLLLMLVRKRDVTTLLMVLFVYGTLHFGFAAIALTSDESARLLIALHDEGSGMLATIATLSLLAVTFVLLSMHAYRAYLLSQSGEKKMIMYVLLIMGAVLCGYALNIRQGDWLQLKNVISIEAMLAFLLIGYLGATGAHTLNMAKIYSWGVAELLVFAAIDGIAVYEVFNHHSWAGTLESSGAMVYRASSILFNPNLLAFWASLVYLGCAYGVHAFRKHQKMMLCGMVLASVAIYLSGSRSAAFLLLAVLFIPLWLKEKRIKWLSLLVLPLTMLAIYLGAAWFAGQFVLGSAGWHSVVLLGERFADAPIYLVNYVSTLFGVPHGVPLGVPPEVMQSIEGRFVGEGRDAGWLVLYQDVGWIGTAVMLLSCFVLLLWSMRAYYAVRSAASAYALAILCYLVLMGLVMRFQIFPVWLFIGVILTPCLVFWSRTASRSSLPMGRVCAS